MEIPGRAISGLCSRSGRSSILQGSCSDTSVPEPPSKILNWERPKGTTSSEILVKFWPKAECFDERQITHLICARLKYDLFDFLRGCFGPASCSFSFRKGPKTPPKKVISIIV